MQPQVPRRFACLLLVCGSLIAPNAQAQVWSSQFTAPYLDGPVHDMVIYQDQLIVAGDFTGAGFTALGYLARWDGTQWQPLGAPFDGTVFDLLVSGDDLLAAGSFEKFGDTAANHVARWNGSSWSALGSGLPGTVSRLGEHQGNVVAIGPFVGVMDQPQYVAVWNGSVWNGIEGWPNAPFAPLAVASDGINLYAGYSGVHAWNGASWNRVGELLVGGAVQDLLVHDNALIAAGAFSEGVLRWNGESWELVSPGLSGDVSRLEVVDGQLLAMGSFWKGGVPTKSGVFRWTGDDWLVVGEPIDDPVHALASYNGELVIGLWSNPSPFHVRQLQADHWKPMESFLPGMNGLDGPVNALRLFQGSLVAGGSFSIAGGVEVNNIARWDGTSWHALGAGIGGVVWTLAEFDDRLVVGGTFTTAGGDSARSIATWDGTAWSTLGGGVTVPEQPSRSPRVYALNNVGDYLIAGGSFTKAGETPVSSIARWDGQSWSAMAGGIRGEVFSLKSHEDRLYAGGYIFGENRAWWGLQRWDGSAWLPAGPIYGNSGFEGITGGAVNALEVFNGKLDLGGQFTSGGDSGGRNVASRDAGQMPGLSGPIAVQVDCYPCDQAFVEDFAVYHDQLVACGFFEGVEGSEPVLELNGLARWDGQQWSAMGAGLRGFGEFVSIFDSFIYETTPFFPATGQALAVDGDVLYVGGSFFHADGVPSYYLASYYEERTPIHLTAFTVTWDSDHAVVSWAIAAPDDLAGFHVHREIDGVRARISNTLISGGSAYSFTDLAAPPRGADYWLEEVSRDGSSTWHGPVTLAPLLARHVLGLSQNVPNPFAGSTRIAFTLSIPGPVRLDVLDIQGRQVATLVSGVFPAGDHEITWDGTDGRGTRLRAGIYLYRLETEAGTFARKLIIGLD